MKKLHFLAALFSMSIGINAAALSSTDLPVSPIGLTSLETTNPELSDVYQWSFEKSSFPFVKKPDGSISFEDYDIEVNITAAQQEELLKGNSIMIPINKKNHFTSMEFFGTKNDEYMTTLVLQTSIIDRLQKDGSKEITLKLKHTLLEIKAALKFIKISGTKLGTIKVDDNKFLIKPDGIHFSYFSKGFTLHHQNNRLNELKLNRVKFDSQFIFSLSKERINYQMVLSDPQNPYSIRIDKDTAIIEIQFNAIRKDA